MSKYVTLADLDRKINMILGVMLDPAGKDMISQGKSVDEALRAEAARLTHITGNAAYLIDYQKAKIAARGQRNGA